MSTLPAFSPRRGAISILVAVGILVFLMIVGIGIDTALVMTANQQLQRAADSAALAAANQIQLYRTGSPPDSSFALVRQKAIESALQNRVIRCGPNGLQLEDNPTNAPAGSGRTDILIGRWTFNRTTNVFEFVRTDFATGLPFPDCVQIYPRCGDSTLNSALALFFSPIFGATATSTVGRPATAVLGPRDTPLILVLDPHGANALDMNGSVIMDVEAGTIQVDSDDACAFHVNGVAAQMRAQRTRVVGDACLNPANLTGDLITRTTYVPDPLASLPEPTTAGMTNFGAITGPGTYAPGYYPNGIDLNGGATILLPGIYYIGGAGSAGGIDLKGNTVLTGLGVMLYLAPGASIHTSGGAGMVLTPPTSGTYEWISVFQARTGVSESSIGGGGIFDVRGTYYVPNGLFEMTGNVSRAIGRIIVWRLNLSGNTTYTITGYDVPPTPSPLYVFLVK